MTEPRIDSLARFLAGGLSRRRLISGFGDGLTATGLVVLSKPSLVCQRAGTTCGDDHPCCRGSTCHHGTCRCLPDWAACGAGASCIDPNTDANHCGRCGNACSASERCCAGRCVEAARDRANRGRCGTVCRENELCVLDSCLACPLNTLPCRNVCRPPDRCVEARCSPA